MDTFQDMTPIEVGEEVENTGDPTMDTFDNIEPIIPEEKPAVKVEEEGKRQQDQLDEEEDVVKKEEPKKEDLKKEEKEEEDTEAPKSEEKEEAPKSEPKGKVLRVKSGDDTIKLDEEATVKVKVDGKGQFVTIKELRDNYSGKVSYDEKFQGLQKENHDLRVQKGQFEEQKGQIMGHVSSLVESLDDISKNPIDAVMNFLDTMGRSDHNHVRRLYESQMALADELSDLDPVERELFWKNKQIEHQANTQATRRQETEQKQAQEELFARVDSLREQHGVSEQDYMDSYHELAESVDKAQITPENVVKHAALKPHFISATGICEQFLDDMDDSDYEELVSVTANTMFRYPNISEEQAVKLAADHLGYEVSSTEDIDKELSRKISDQQKQSVLPKKKKYAEVEDENHIESFDDFNI